MAAPKCLFCGSMDTMPPFRKSERIPLLTAILPMRRRFCRECARHFISFTRPSNGGRVYRTEKVPTRPPPFMGRRTSDR